MLRLAVILLFVFQTAWSQTMPSQKEVFTQVVKTVEANLRISEENQRLFGQCYDWHSAVHCYWAIFEIALRDAEFNPQANYFFSRFTSDAIAHEIKTLRESPNFEMPYGRAWLLLLSISLQKWCEQNQVSLPDNFKKLEQIAFESVSADLHKIMKSSNFVALFSSNEYQSYSWSTYCLLKYLQNKKHSGLQGLKENLQKWAEKLAGNISFSRNLENGEFFSPAANLILLFNEIFETSDVKLQSLNQQLSSASDISIIDIGRHRAALPFSRAWGIKILARKVVDLEQRVKFQNSFESNFTQAWSYYLASAHDLYYGHWVGQFALFAFILD